MNILVSVRVCMNISVFRSRGVTLLALIDFVLKFARTHTHI